MHRTSSAMIDRAPATAQPHPQAPSAEYMLTLRCSILLRRQAHSRHPANDAMLFRSKK